MDKKKLIESTLKEAERDLLKEYALRQKAELTSLIKLLMTSGVDEKEMKNLTDFYRPNDKNFNIEDDLLYNEFKGKLLDLANEKGINLPEKYKV